MLSIRSAAGRSVGVRRLDVATAVVLAVLSFAAGRAARPCIGFPWDQDGPTMASTEANQRVARADETLRELLAIRERARSRLADEQLAQWAQLVKSRRSSPRDAVKLKADISDRQALMNELRARLNSMIPGEVAAASELRVATDEARKSEEATVRRLKLSEDASLAALSLAAWAMLAIVFSVCWAFQADKTNFPRGRIALFGSLVSVLAAVVGVAVGWVLVTAAGIIALLGWAMGGNHHV